MAEIIDARHLFRNAPEHFCQCDDCQKLRNKKPEMWDKLREFLTREVSDE